MTLTGQAEAALDGPPVGNDGVAYGQRLWAAAQVIALSRYEAGEDFRYMRITLARCTELLVPLPRVSTGDSVPPRHLVQRHARWDNARAARRRDRLAGRSRCPAGPPEREPASGLTDRVGAGAGGTPSSASHLTAADARWPGLNVVTGTFGPAREASGRGVMEKTREG